MRHDLHEARPRPVEINERAAVRMERLSCVLREITLSRRGQHASRAHWLVSGVWLGSWALLAYLLQVHALYANGSR
jgi:hypothetical protein